jgi:Family of unknown function (DUF6350)
VTSLLTRRPTGGADGPGERRGGAVAWLAPLAALAVPVTGLLVLGLAMVVVQALDPSGGLPLSSSARVAGQLWLLAHGAQLDLVSGPIRIAPLLLTLVAGWGLDRAAAGVVGRLGLTDAREVGLVVGAQVAVHTAVTAALAFLLDRPGAGVGLLRPTLGAFLLALVAAGAGALRESGLSVAVLDRLPGPAGTLGRAVAAGLLTLVAGCLLVVAVALAADAHGAARIADGLGGAGAGAAGLLGLSLLLLPNAGAAVAGLAAGPGFTVGSGTAVSVGGVTLGQVPALPLLAALPDTQAVPLLAFAAQVLPALAGLVAGTVVGRRLAEGGSVTAALWGLAAGVGLGLATGVWVLLAHGRLGDAGLASVGAPALATGLAVAGQAALAAALAAAVTRWRGRS